jgi:hypothetical protein
VVKRRVTVILGFYGTPSATEVHVLDLSTLLIFSLLVAAIGYAVYHKLKRDEALFSRLYKPVDDSLIDSGGEFEGVLNFAGEGWFRTNPFRLEAGKYKLAYWFSEAVLVKVELFTASGDDSEVIALKRGTGAESFSVAGEGRYFCVIEPAVGDEAWEIEISRLGLPSQRAAQI